jgi:hypothetical protein
MPEVIWELPLQTFKVETLSPTLLWEVWETLVETLSLTWSSEDLVLDLTDLEVTPCLTWLWDLKETLVLKPKKLNLLEETPFLTPSLALNSNNNNHSHNHNPNHNHNQLVETLPPTWLWEAPLPLLPLPPPANQANLANPALKELRR